MGTSEDVDFRFSTHSNMTNIINMFKNHRGLNWNVTRFKNTETLFVNDRLRSQGINEG